MQAPTMAVTSSRCLVSTLCCLIFYLLSSSVHHVPHAAALSFHFNFSHPDSTCTAQNAELACSGDAYFHSTESAIELTKNDMGYNNNHSVGRLTYTRPVPLWDGATGELASFTTTFSFRIKPARQEPSADGMAFFLAAQRPSDAAPPPGSFGWNLGLFNDSTNRRARGDARVVAVEFDTYRNAEWEDADDNHVGIDVNSIVSVDSVSPNASIKSGETLVAEVAYDNTTATLSVALWMGDGVPYRVSAAVDMRRSLPQTVAVGFSAATGISVEMHQLLTWSFNSSLASRGQNENDVTSPSPGGAPAPVPSKRHSKAHSGTKAVSASAAAAVFVVICALIGFVLRRKLRIWKKSKEASGGGGGGGELDDEHDGGEAEFERGVGPKRYCYSELAAATCNFSEEMKLGRGGFGHVYQGCLKIDGQDRRVAIKKFSESSVQGRKEFEAEVRIISRLRHRNLVQLIGWCDSCKGLLIVYELVSEGSLDRHLYNKARMLTWPQRYKIVVGLGSALRYLHAEWEQCVVHGDIKPSNIMLDFSLDAKLGDFGLARLVDHGVKPATTKVVLGTAGYIDPELVNTRRPSAVSDVYSFGIVLLELVTGRHPVEEPDDSDELFVLVRWAWRLYSRNAIAEAVDERLMISQGDDGGEVEERRQQMERALVVGLWCAHPDQGERPSITRAMHVLQSADAKLPMLRPQRMYSLDTFHTLTMGGDGYSDLSFGATSTGSHTTTTSGCNSRSENE